MRFKQYLLESTLKPVDINRWLARYADYLDNIHWEQTPQGLVFDRTLYLKEHSDFKKIPFKISSIKNGGFYLKSCYNLASTENMPDSIAGDLNIMHTEINTMNGLPTYIGGYLFMDGCSITSFVGMQHQLEKMHIGLRMWHTWEDVTEGGIGLLLIKGLKGITTAQHELPKPFEIINKYMDRKDDIYECQAELIDNGFEEYAKL